MTTPKSDIRQAKNGGKVAESKLTPAMERLSQLLANHEDVIKDFGKDNLRRMEVWEIYAELHAASQAVLDELRASEGALLAQLVEPGKSVKMKINGIEYYLFAFDEMTYEDEDPAVQVESEQELEPKGGRS